MKDAPNSSRFAPLFQLDLDAGAFSADWRHCDRVANYLARLASFDRSDTLLYSNLFSTVMNELFEIAFLHHTPPGAVRCTVSRAGALDRIELEIPAGEADFAFYESAVAAAQSPDVKEEYTTALLSADRAPVSAGFLELAADYGAGMWLEPLAQPGGPGAGQSGVRIITIVQLEQSEDSSMRNLK